MQERGETWLAEGLGYVAPEGCPFCGQSLDGVELIGAYRSYFSREYHALRNEVTAMNGQVETAVGHRVSAAIEQTSVQNNGSVEFWQAYCDIAPPPLLGAASQGKADGGAPPIRASPSSN